MNEFAAYTPTAGQSDPFASGTVSLSGQGTLSRSFQGVQQSRVVARSTNPSLHWNAACRAADPTATGYDSGTVLYADDMGGTLQVVFNGCENPTITNNGQ